MRIVITHNDFRAYFPPRLLALQVELEKRGDELFIIELFEESIDYGFTIEDKSVFHHHEFLFNTYIGISMLKIKKKLMARLDDINPEVVLCWAIPFPAGAIAVKWANFNGKPVISMDDAQKDTFQRSKLNHFLKKRIFKHVDAFICPSDKWNETMMFWGFKKKQIFYGINAVDNEFWSKHTNKDIGLKDFILCVGRQIPIKKHIDLLKAYKLYVNEKGGESRDLVFIGDGEERKHLEEYVRINQLNKVHFLPFLPPVDLRDYYHNASIFALVSLRETFGLVVNEAMNASCPLILTDTVGCSNMFVQQNRNGYIVPVGDIQEIANAMITFDNLSDFEQKRAGVLSKTIISDWGLEKFTQNITNAIEYVLKQKRKKINLMDRIILYCWNGRLS